MKQLNLGCGRDYRIGFINHDSNHEVKADVYFDLEKMPYPFESDEFDYILLDNVLEHIYPNKMIQVVEELWRIGKRGCLIEIYTPHYSGMYAFSHLTHYSFFGCGKFDQFKVEDGFNGERYSAKRFNVEEKLLFFHHNLKNMSFLSYLPINWFFNFSSMWRRLMERFQFFGFDEIRYRLEVVK